MSDGGKPSLYVWDVPTRLIHWALAILFAFSWWSAKTDHLPWHRISGDLILGLLLFRLSWGVAGSSSARFAGFVRGPRAILGYVRGQGYAGPGHNPLGGLSVVALIGLLCVQVGLGLFSVDEDFIEGGPMSRFVDNDLGRQIAHLHHLTFNILLGLVILHLAAIGVYELRRKRLILPMLTGRTPARAGWSDVRRGSPLLALILAAVVAVVTWFVAHGLRFTGSV
ncbi:cytochrome b/b6 domain-containing protein [Caulobacter sp. KR2-114]|uniref:cytochrome b/b6 domain-containing protein n=1 Tax=Caulobacter sp. KR2-114 TaxID=3400912 RepID=UPI003C0C1A3A